MIESFGGAIAFGAESVGGKKGWAKIRSDGGVGSWGVGLFHGLGGSSSGGECGPHLCGAGGRWGAGGAGVGGVERGSAALVGGDRKRLGGGTQVGRRND